MKSRVLIADSDADLRDILRTFLSASGYDVAMATDGLKCLEQIERFQPDVLVVEREMPWGGGDSVVAKLREEHPPLAMEVVIITDDGRDFEPAAPVVACLEKPFSMELLLEALQAGSGNSFKSECEPC